MRQRAAIPGAHAPAGAMGRAAQDPGCAHAPIYERRGLQLLARSPNGCTEALMMAHGFGQTGARRPCAGCDA
jgi:hypothetical protein